MRDTGGVVLCTNPEARTVLDPGYVSRLIADDKHYLNLSYLLETASGGSYEWITASDLRRARAAREAVKVREEQGEDPLPVEAPENNFLSFRHTSVNLCYFQQLSVLGSWWVPLERKHALGFSSRILFAFSQRALVDRDLGRGSAHFVAELLQNFWLTAASRYGHACGEAPPLALNPSQEAEVSNLYYEIGELSAETGWGTASVAALGKLEYHVGMMSQLTHLLEQNLRPDGPAPDISDNALKCAFRFFDRRLLHGCAVIDRACASRADEEKNASSSRVPQRHAEADSVGRVLRQCIADPISVTEMGRRLACLRKDADFSQRRALLQQIVDLDLGILEESSRGGGFVLRRSPLTEERKMLLNFLDVPVDRFQLEMRGCGGEGVSTKDVAAALLHRVWPRTARRDPEPFSPPSSPTPWLYSGVAFMRLSFKPANGAVDAVARSPTPDLHVGQQIYWNEEEETSASCPVFPVTPAAGTYAVVRCAGESSFRALWTLPAEMGRAAGHAGLAAELPEP